MEQPSLKNLATSNIASPVERESNESKKELPEAMKLNTKPSRNVE